jgi:hypothetical protein
MVSNSRINSWETWFIFNLQRKKNKIVMHPAYYIFRFPMNHEHHDFFIFIYTYLSNYPLQQLANTSTLASSWS